MISHSSANDIAALPPGVKLTTLDNGLVIIVREDHSAPVVSRAGVGDGGQHPRGALARRGAVARAGAHAVQGHHDAARQPD